MVFQMFALGPHSLQKLSSAEFPEDAPVSRFQMPLSPEVDDVTEDDVDDAGDANPCNVFGTVVTSCDSDWLPVPAEVAVAWATAPDWPASAPALVFCVGPVNGVSWVAAADEPA